MTEDRSIAEIIDEVSKDLTVSEVREFLDSGPWQIICLALDDRMSRVRSILESASPVDRAEDILKAQGVLAMLHEIEGIPDALYADLTYRGEDK